MQRCWVAVMACVMWLGGVACAGNSITPATATTSNAQPPAACEYYDYRFELDASLRLLSATVCFDGAPPRALVCGPQGDADYAPRAERISGDTISALPTAACRIDLSSIEAGDCVRYQIALHELSDVWPLSLGITDAERQASRLITAQTGAFLFRPETRDARFHGHATLSLPDGVSASLPWRRDVDGYLLDSSAFELVGYAAFGQITTAQVTAAGATIDVALLGEVAAATSAAIVPWITRVASTTAQLGGAFPTDRAQVLLLPLPGDGGVRFGMVGRGGGPSILFLIGRDSTEAELMHSWEPAHEITHLRTPYLRRADRYLSEGIATYYQEVLRARDGVLTQQEAWRRLSIGFERGAQDGTGRTLRNESKDMYETHAFQRVYWFGAALALLIDIELRSASQGRESLDTAILKLQACCANDARGWSGDDMIEKLDALTGGSAVSEVLKRYLDTTAYPDVAATFAQLGVKLDNGQVTLDSSAPRSAIRDAIMSPHAITSPHASLTVVE